MRFFIYIVFTCVFCVNAQNNDSIPIFEYDINYNLGKALVKKGYVFQFQNNVYYNTSKTMFLESIEKLTTDESTGIPNINLLSAGNGSENNISLSTSQTHIGTYSLGPEMVQTTEDLQKQKWLPTGQELQVNGRNCIEMTADFRGRTYLAYVDLTVPINFGPWKFNSFPGLPVLIHDTEHKLKWTLTKIGKDSRGEIINFIENQARYLEPLKKMTLKEYVKWNDATENGHKLLVSKLPRDFKPEQNSRNHKRGGFELKFEWETEK